MFHPPIKKAAPGEGGGYRAKMRALYGASPVDASDAVTTAAMGFADRRDDVELSLVGAILAAPAVGVTIARREGVTQWHFARPDLYLIHIAASVAGGHGIGTVLRLARAALRTEGFWADLQIAGNLGSMQWSDASLIRLARSWPFSPSVIRELARELIHIDCRHRLARAHYRACLAILEGRDAA